MARTGPLNMIRLIKGRKRKALHLNPLGLLPMSFLSLSLTFVS